MRGRVVVAGTCSVVVGFLWLAVADDARALTIDSFSTAQTATVITPSTSATSEATGSGILGNERDIEVTLTSGTGVTVAISAGKLTYGHIASSTGTGLIVWDGEDGSSALDATGLGGVDFTESGAEDRVTIGLLFNDFSASMTLTAYTDASNYSTASLTLPGDIPPDPATTLMALFTDFSTAAGSGADFTNIGALSLYIDGSSTAALDVELDFVVNPQPSTAALLGIGILGIVLMRRHGWAV